MRARGQAGACREQVREQAGRGFQQGAGRRGGIERVAACHPIRMSTLHRCVLLQGLLVKHQRKLAKWAATDTTAYMSMQPGQHPPHHLISGWNSFPSAQQYYSTAHAYAQTMNTALDRTHVLDAPCAAVCKRLPAVNVWAVQHALGGTLQYIHNQAQTAAYRFRVDTAYSTAT
jgi:hypothetical protein